MADNIYFRYRKLAAERNDALKSRAGAAELLGVSESSLAHYELGVTKTVPVDVVVMMAELYGAPELKYHYCKAECPIGGDCPWATQDVGIADATIHLLNGITNDALKDAAQKLLRIAADGIVTAEEAEQMRPVQEAYHDIIKAISELDIVLEKAQKRGGNDDGGID